MKHGTDFDLGDTFTTVGGHEWRVEAVDVTPEAAGVPAEFVANAEAGSQILFDGMIYENGMLFVQND